MRSKRLSCILLALILVMSPALFGCKKDNIKEKYGSPVDFDGPAHEVKVMFVNVGKADCAIVLVDGRAWLIDTGTEESIVNVYCALSLLGVKSIDGIILTHQHEDHIGGAEAVCARFGVGKAVYPEYLNDSSPIDKLVSGAGLEKQTAKAGDRITVVPDEGGRVEFEILAPSERDPNDDNDNSLVVKLRVNGRTFLFTGDMQTAEDGRLVSSGADIKCDVLKVPNHGNPDATSDAFAKAASPLISIISTDTSVDKDSANSKVRAKLFGSEIHLTQDSPVGVLITVSSRGEISVSDPERPAALSGIELIRVSKQEQAFTVRNTTGETIDISGWFVYSTKGYEAFSFPEGTTMLPGSTLTVACSGSAVGADIIWNIKKAWADKKDDEAVLCDPGGNEISRMKSE